jgi:hypothetical protein
MIFFPPPFYDAVAAAAKKINATNFLSHFLGNAPAAATTVAAGVAALPEIVVLAEYVPVSLVA